MANNKPYWVNVYQNISTGDKVCGIKHSSRKSADTMCKHWKRHARMAPVYRIKVTPKDA